MRSRTSELATSALTLSFEILCIEDLSFAVFPIFEYRTADEEGDLMPLASGGASTFVFPSELEVVLSEGRTNCPLDLLVSLSLILALSEIK